MLKTTYSSDSKGRRSSIYMLPGAWWAMRLRQVTGETFEDLDQAFCRLDPKRAATGSIPEIERFAKGRKTLQFAREDHKTLRQLANSLDGAAGLETEYMSLTWDEMFLAVGAARRKPFNLGEVNADLMGELKAHDGIASLQPNGIVLTQAGVLRCSLTRHIDALGLLLMQRRMHRVPIFSSLDIFHIRVWLGNARLMFSFRANQQLYLDAMGEAYPELGPMMGEDGIKLIPNEATMRNARDRFENSFVTFGRLELVWLSPYAADQSEVCVPPELSESQPCWAVKTHEVKTKRSRKHRRPKSPT